MSRRKMPSSGRVVGPVVPSSLHRRLTLSHTPSRTLVGRLSILLSYLGFWGDALDAVILRLLAVAQPNLRCSYGGTYPNYVWPRFGVSTNGKQNLWWFGHFFADLAFTFTFVQCPKCCTVWGSIISKACSACLLQSVEGDRSV